MQRRPQHLSLRQHLHAQVARPSVAFAEDHMRLEEAVRGAEGRPNQAIRRQMRPAGVYLGRIEHVDVDAQSPLHCRKALRALPGRVGRGADRG